jgi:hypothetical protein
MKNLLEDSGLELAPRIPCNDLAEFYRLCTENQDRVRKMLSIFEIIEAAANRKSGLAMAVEVGSGEKGFSASRLEIYFYEYLKANRDWRVGVNWAWEGSKSRSLPEEFVFWLQQQVDKRQRKVQQALKQVRDAWKRGSSIPGYGTWRQWWTRENPGLSVPDYCPGFPEGWHLRNLRRYLDSSKFRRVAQTVGLVAAKSLRPSVLTTRKGLWVMSHVQFDDLEHDFFANTLAEKQAGRPLELFSHDLFSARKIRYGIRVKTINAEGKANKLTERMMRMIVAATFYMDGYSPRGTTICAEHGTAAVRDWLEKMLFELSGGLIQTTRSGFSGDVAHIGQYAGIRRGNPNFKASLESSNNLTHNVLDHIPAQTGLGLSRRPEGLEAMLDHNAELLAAIQQAPAHIARNIVLEIVTVEQLMEILAYYYGYIEDDHEHELEGWEECGHVIQELHLANRWLTQQDLLALPPGEYEMARALLGAGQLVTRPRRMSRREVWNLDSESLIKIPPYGVCEILGDDMSEERKVRAGKFEFEDSDVGPGVHTYDAIVTNLEGYRMELREGEKYQAFVNPFAIEHLFVRDAKGRYIGVADRVQRPCRADIKGVGRAMGAAAHRLAERLEPLRERQAEEAQRRLDNIRHNESALRGETIVEEKTRAREIKTLVRQRGADALDDMMDEPAPSTLNPRPSTNLNDALIDEILS